MKTYSKIIKLAGQWRLRNILLPGRPIFAHYLTGNGIEIGALGTPMTALPATATITYVDHLDNDGLRHHYPELSGKPMVHVDKVATASTLSDAFNPQSLDFIIANHIIEHVDNPLAALIQFHGLLRMGGIVHLAIPDRRLTFDRERPRTSLDHLVKDLEDPSGPTKDERDFQHYVEWVKYVPPYLPEHQKAYQSDVSKLWANRYSIHLHVWEPDDWPPIITYLSSIGYPFRLLDYFNVPSIEDRNEFILILQKSDTLGDPIPCPLPERGPWTWHFVRLLRRIMLRGTVRRLVRHWRRQQAFSRAPTG
jgi:SAM-dependent methyltransferase